MLYVPKGDATGATPDTIRCRLNSTLRMIKIWEKIVKDSYEELKPEYNCSRLTSRIHKLVCFTDSI